MGWKHESEREESEKILLKIYKENGVFNPLLIFFHVICKCTKCRFFVVVMNYIANSASFVLMVRTVPFCPTAKSRVSLSVTRIPCSKGMLPELSPVGSFYSWK